MNNFSASYFPEIVKKLKNSLWKLLRVENDKIMYEWLDTWV